MGNIVNILYNSSPVEQEVPEKNDQITDRHEFFVERFKDIIPGDQNASDGNENTSESEI
jgi:hypothetical protein